MVECRVEFEYIAEQDDELTIKVGDIIKNVKQFDGGWWEGELNGSRGMFPDNFVKVVNKDKKSSKKDPKANNTTDDFKMAAAVDGDGMAVKSGHVKELKNQLSKQGSLQLVVKKDSKKKKLGRVRATQSYTAEEDDELTFAAGDVIEVTEKDSDNWWRGHLLNKETVGSFPVKCIEQVDDDEQDNGEVVEIQPKKVKGVGLGDIFKNEHIKLRNVGGSKKEEKNPSKASVSPEEPGPIPPKPIKPRTSIIRETKEFAKVLFSYDAANEDELSLKDGDQILILDKDIEDEGWWKGELNGKQGVFPNNFVELIENKPKRPQPQPLKKLSERPLPAEPKQEKVVTPKEERPPPLPGKKPDVPPPPPGSKRGLRSSVKEEKSSPTEEAGLDAVGSTEPALKHPNLSRPQGPNKRLPSKNLLRKEMNGDEPDYDLPSSDEPSNNNNNKISDTVIKVDQPKQKPPPLPPTPSKIQSESSADSGVNNRLVEELRAEIRDLKASTVSKHAYDDLKDELQELREQLHVMRKQFDKRLCSLMNEIDEEKKIRLQTQVDIERVKRLAMENARDSEA